MMTPGKAAWLQRKAERAKKRAEEKRKLTAEGYARTVHVGDLTSMKATDLIDKLYDALAATYDSDITMRDKHGKVTSADLDVLRRELVRRGRKRLRRDKKDVPSSPMTLRFWVEIFSPQEAQRPIWNTVSDNTDIK